MSVAQPGAEPPVRLRVFGTVAAFAGDEEIALGGQRVRALISALALARGRMLSADALLSQVWGGSSPGVRSALRANISRLRSTRLGVHLVGGRQGYALVESDKMLVDLWRAGDWAAASAPDSLDDLATWIDAVPFDGAGDSPFLPEARGAARALLRRAVVRAIDEYPQHPLAGATAERLLVGSPDDPELRALVLTSPGRSDRAERAPAAPARLVAVPAPIAAYRPRPEDESRLAAALRLSRLVTLVGPAGVGKTRLALEWARGPGGASREHVWFCRVEGEWLTDLSRVVGAGDASLESVIARMRPLRGTIVLDGLDDAPDAAPLAALLEQAPGIVALVTARQALGVPGESVHHLSALGVSDARALFRMRSSASFDDTDIDALTAELGRLPIAIELAAARVTRLPAAAVLDALIAQRADAEGSVLDATLSATLALLTDAQRATLARLCVFHGPFTPASSSAVAGGSAEAHLDALVGWSLATDESLGDLVLLRVPELVRRHLGSEAAEAAEALRARHTEWFGIRSLAAFDELTTAAAGAAWQRLETERADIDAAFEHAIADGDRASALSIAAGRSWWGLMSGSQASVLAASRRADEVGRDAAAQVAAGIEARARLGRGILSYQLGFMREAAGALDGALESARTAGEPDLVALAHAYIAYLATLTSGGTRAATEGIARARAVPDDVSPSARAMVTLISAQVERARGNLERALQYTQEARVLAAGAGHNWVLLMSSVVAAKVAIDARDPAAALTLIHGALGDESVRADPISVLIATSVAAGAAAGLQADAAGARIVGGVAAIGRRYGFDPRANEPADFDRYHRLVRQGLTPEGWRDAYAHGTSMTLTDLVDEVARLASSSRARR